MLQPQLYVVTGPNAAGKSSFIRSRLNDFVEFEVIMTDVFKERTKEVFYNALNSGKNIVLETVFNNSSFKNYIDDAKKAGYFTNLIMLFLNSPQDSMDRVASRYLDQNGLNISKGNVEINFNENFKNVSSFYFYFDRADFVYTGVKDKNENFITFRGLDLIYYKSNSSYFLKAFAKYAISKDRLTREAYNIINENKNFSNV